MQRLAQSRQTVALLLWVRMTLLLRNQRVAAVPERLVPLTRLANQNWQAIASSCPAVKQRMLQVQVGCLRRFCLRNQKLTTLPPLQLKRRERQPVT